VVVIVQENRSFDSYFGTYDGADGFPTRHGRLSVCVPNPATRRRAYPYHDPALVNVGGKNNAFAATADTNRGKMNGSIAEAQKTSGHVQTDVMGYHDAREMPNYWTYARDFVLRDHMFEPDASWSLPSHLFTVSEWAANCSSAAPSSCVNDDNQGNFSESSGGSVVAKLADRIYPDLNHRNAKVETAVRRRAAQPLPATRALLPHSTDFAWTDMTYLLHTHHVPWAYYVAPGTEPDCADDAALCGTQKQGPGTPGIWNPLPNFQTVRSDRQEPNSHGTDDFYTAVRQSKLPAVSWLVPNRDESEHAPAVITDGQAYVTSIIDAIMRSREWNSTAIFLTWDDWGGFYDHVRPPARRRERLRTARPGAGDQPLRPSRLHRPPDPVLRCL
jgi:phospholipase C